MFLTEKEIHLKALQKAEDSEKIKTSMTVVRLGFVTSMLKDMQEKFRKKLIEKDLEIQELKSKLNMQ